MKTLLKKYFGYEEFRPLQKEAILNVIDSKDTLVLMPTGGGKSMCFQLPALKLPGLTLVISPLIALMKDQVDSLQSCGISAEFINSSLEQSQINNIIERVKEKKVKILYIAPERFALKTFQNFLQKIEISLIAIDEAHCISEWGHDFRPDYRNLSMLKKMFPAVPLIALTATATKKVKDDILKQLNIRKANIFASSFDRENLKISVIEKKQSFPKLVQLLEDYKKESVIIYAFSRKETEELAENLNMNDFNARPYHAGLSASNRKDVQDLFIKDKINIIVATIAFGMGIDKPDVRLVVHYTYPKTLESYYQEIGRAGRDGLSSECVMFYTYADTRRHQFFINQISGERLRIQAEEKLAEVLNFADLMTCRKKYLLKYFGEDMPGENCSSCDICLTKKEEIDASVISRKILSAVVRTGNRYGKNYIIDVLLGKKNQKILRNRHNELSVFGIVNDFSENELAQIINQLVFLNLIMKDSGTYPTLSITKKGADFMQSKRKLKIVKPKKELVNKIKVVKDNIDYNLDLFEELRVLRKEIAEKIGMPPFVVFGDNSLREMAAFFPKTREAFSEMSGVGTVKLEKYSKDFLRLIINFTKKNKIDSIKKKNGLVKRENEMKSIVPKQKFYSRTRELLIKKISIERIAKNQDIKIDTVVNHIEKMIDDGLRLDLEYLKLPKDRYNKIKNAFMVCGDELLRPVYEYLDKKYSYDEIKLARVLLRS